MSDGHEGRGSHIITQQSKDVTVPVIDAEKATGSGFNQVNSDGRLFEDGVQQLFKLDVCQTVT